MVHMIPKLKVGTLQLQDNCMLHIKQLIKPAAPITLTLETLPVFKATCLFRHLHSCKY